MARRVHCGGCQQISTVASGSVSAASWLSKGQWHGIDVVMIKECVNSRYAPSDGSARSRPLCQDLRQLFGTSRAFAGR